MKVIAVILLILMSSNTLAQNSKSKKTQRPTAKSATIKKHEKNTEASLPTVTAAPAPAPAPEPSPKSETKPAIEPEQSKRILRFVINAGLTTGGDELARAYYTDGSSESLDAGGSIYLNGGVSADIPNTPLTLQMTLGRHLADPSIPSGEMSFSRNTTDLQIFFRHGKHRFGIGTVKHTSGKVVLDIPGFINDTYGFANTVGRSLEYNYLPWTTKNDGHLGITLRYVTIDYKINNVNGFPVSSAESISGNHFGLGLNIAL